MTAALRTVPREEGAPRLRIVLRPAPRREPPFEDELPPSGVLPGYDQVLPFERTVVRRHAVAHPIRRGSLPDPAVWARRLLIGLVETADGRRPLAQISPLLSQSVGRGIALDLERNALAGRPHWLHRAVVRGVRACEPAEGVAELSATVEVGDRVRAVALRVEAFQGRWRCTRLQLG